MIKDFLILNCIGKNDKIGLRISNNFYTHDFDKKINNNDQLVLSILNLTKKHKVNFDNNFSILVNSGPGRFSSIRASIAVAKGIKIVHGSKILGYKNNQLLELNLENIENLIKNKQLENKMVNPIYQ